MTMDINVLRRRHALTDRGLEVWLVEVYEPDGVSPVLTICNNTEDVVKGATTYTGYSMRLDPPKADLEGSLPSANLVISNVTRGLQSAMRAANFYRGGTLKIIAFNADEPTADFTPWTKEMLIVNHRSNLREIILNLSVPQKLLAMVPDDLVGPANCRHRFRKTRCGYVGKTIQGVTLSSTNPVSIQANGHGLTTGVTAQLESVGGITPALAGLYVVTRTDDNNFTLDDTDSSDYSGSYTSGGKAGYAYCEGNRLACRTRGRVDSFGACPGLRPDGLILGA